MVQYAIDIMNAALRMLSGQEPFLFQRDSFTFGVTPRAFGVLNYNVATRLGRHPTTEEKSQLDESEDVLQRRQFAKGELARIRPLLYRSWEQKYTPKSLRETAEELAKLPDDGSVRLISVSTHKPWTGNHPGFTYSIGNTTFFVDSARRMKRDTFLTCLREEEQKYHKHLQAIDPARAKEHEREHCTDPYWNANIPNCAIVTPNVALALPQKGYFGEHQVDCAWDDETRLFGVPFTPFEKMKSFRHSPYGATVLVKNQRVATTSASTFTRDQGGLVGRLSHELGSIGAVMPTIEAYVCAYNNQHNAMWHAEKPVEATKP